ncbi:MAG TPA: hypothetical protein PKD12_08115 [Nitrospira sp.]|nr:hypothetical protein [Nitrospira sp.]
MTTKMDIANFAADVTVSAVIRRTLTTVITSNTEKTEDDLIVIVPTIVAAWYLSDRLQPYTHAAVAKAATKLSTFRDNRLAKKQA